MPFKSRKDVFQDDNQEEAYNPPNGRAEENSEEYRRIRSLKLGRLNEYIHDIIGANVLRQNGEGEETYVVFFEIKKKSKNRGSYNILFCYSYHTGELLSEMELTPDMRENIWTEVQDQEEISRSLFSFDNNSDNLESVEKNSLRIYLNPDNLNNPNDSNYPDGRIAYGTYHIVWGSRRSGDSTKVWKMVVQSQDVEIMSAERSEVFKNLLPEERIAEMRRIVGEQTPEEDTADMEAQHAETEPVVAAERTQTGLSYWTNNLSFKEINDQMEELGYDSNPDVLAQFICALDSNQIIILHGAPGMGKTSFVEKFADAVGAEKMIIPVRPNWVDNQDLMGFYNPVEHRYYATPFMDVLCEADENRDKRYFICLDEMNLAYIEHYFSDILSAMQSGQPIALYSKRDWEAAISWCNKVINNNDISEMDRFHAEQTLENLERYKAEFKIPANVQFIGTLNMDATTKELSPKVIDRSFIIEVIKNYSAENGSDESSSDELRHDDVQSILSGLYSDFHSSLDERWKELFEEMGFQISRRVQNQIKKMTCFLKEPDLGSAGIQEFQDYIISCKCLPMIVGTELPKENGSAEDIFKGLGKYELSCEKLKRMYDEENNTLNYWKMTKQ